MPTTLLPFVDRARSRSLPTTVYEPDEHDGPLPLIVFGHGFHGHPRKFTKLLGAWADVGYLVAAPSFPLTNDEVAHTDREDVVNQPADLAFVLDELLRVEGLADAERVGVAGFSLGGMTALAVGFNPARRDPRPRAVAVISGRFADALGGAHALEPRPLLVVHGTDDQLVPYEKGEAVYNAAQPPKVLVTLEGGRHHEDVEDGEGPAPALVETTLAFWDRFLRDDEGARERLLAARAGAAVRSEGV